MSRDSRDENDARGRIIGLLPGPMSFLCECREPTCYALVGLTAQEFRRIRSDPSQMVVAPGHQGTEDEIVEWSAHYSVLRKPPSTTY